MSDKCIQKMSIIVVFVSLVVIAVLSVSVFFSLPLWCDNQVVAWGGIATAAGALAMALTAMLILSQLRLQTFALELHKDELRYYYIPGLHMRVDYCHTKDRNLDGVPVRFQTTNQATVFDIAAWIEGHKEDIGSSMVQHKGDLDQATADNKWNANGLRPESEFHALFDINQTNAFPIQIMVEWQDIGPERFQQAWELTIDSSNKEDIRYAITPKQKPKRSRPETREN